MIRSFWAIAYNGFREARRNRVTLVLAFFAGLLLLSSSLITDITVATFDRVLIDIGLGGMSLILVLLAIFLSTGLLSREIERRTIFMVVSKPVSRGLFLVARLAGNMLTLTALQLLMGSLLLVEFWVLKTPVTWPTVLAMGMLWFELLVLSALGGWTDVSGSWAFPDDDTQQVWPSFPVVGWRHITAQGRDQYVRLLKKGLLYPLGHRADFTLVIERRLAPGTDTDYLCATTRVCVREPVRDYTQASASHTHDAMLPLRQARNQPARWSWASEQVRAGLVPELGRLAVSG